MGNSLIKFNKKSVVIISLPCVPPTKNISLSKKRTINIKTVDSKIKPYIDYINMPHYTPANGSYTQSVNGTHYVDNYCYGGAVYWDGANGKLNDCNFINCNRT